MTEHEELEALRREVDDMDGQIDLRFKAEQERDELKRKVEVVIDSLNMALKLLRDRPDLAENYIKAALKEVSE